MLYLRGELKRSDSSFVHQNNVTRTTVNAPRETKCAKKKRKLEGRPKSQNVKKAKVDEDHYGMETFKSVEDCVDQLGKRLGAREDQLNVILCFRKAGRILDYECNETASDFGGNVVDCSEKQYTILLTKEGQTNFKMVAIVDAYRLEEGTVLSTLPIMLARSTRPCRRKNGQLKVDGEECKCNEGVSYSLGCSWTWFHRPKACKFSNAQPGTITREKLLCALPGAKTTDLFQIGGYRFFRFNRLMSLMQKRTYTHVPKQLANSCKNPSRTCSKPWPRKPHAPMWTQPGMFLQAPQQL